MCRQRSDGHAIKHRWVFPPRGDLRAFNQFDRHCCCSGIHGSDVAHLFKIVQACKIPNVQQYVQTPGHLSAHPRNRTKLLPIGGTLTGLLEELDRSPACYSEPLLGRVCCGSLSSVKRCKHSYCAGNFELKISQLPIDTSMATKNNANASRGQNLRLQFAKRIGRTLKRP